jgi:ornithine--oxo-acid transaminase
MEPNKIQNSGIDPIELERRHGVRNYHPLPVVITHGEGAWVYDTEGRRHLDALSAYSALNFGHRHPRLVQAAERQLGRLTLTSRAFHNDRLGGFCEQLAELCGKDRVLPMNTGAEAVETAIKTARKWGYRRRGVRAGQATILVCAGNFHGRTTTIVSFSDDPLAREDFGPFTPGFRTIPYGDAAALRAAIDEDVVALLLEPIQGEAGVVIPPAGYLREVRRICSEAGILMIADEIQSGLGRSGRTFACDHEDVQPDVLVLGKALGGGIVPLSAVVADDDVLGVFAPGEHGSTFGGNPLACAVGSEALTVLQDERLADRSATLGDELTQRLRALDHPSVAAIRARGLWVGIQLAPGMPSARSVCERLLEVGVLCKDTHETTVRLAPPLTVGRDELDLLVERLDGVLTDVSALGAGAAA